PEWTRLVPYRKYVFSVARTSKSALSGASNPATCQAAQPTWKSAIQLVWKAALQGYAKHKRWNQVWAARREKKSGREKRRPDQNSVVFRLRSQSKINDFTWQELECRWKAYEDRQAHFGSMAVRKR